VKKLAYLIISLLLLTSSILYAGWSEPVRLTFRGYEMRPQLVAVGDTLHVAWTQIADSEKVSYLQSPDGGQTWGDIIDLIAWGHGGSFVGLSSNDGRLLAGWADYIPFEWGTFAYSLSLSGSNWTPPNYIYGDNIHVGTPVASDLSGDSIYFRAVGSPHPTAAVRYGDLTAQ
jgi:hypothetical protein